MCCNDGVVIIFGLGFTGKKLAHRLLDRKIAVYAAVRGLERFRELADRGLQLVELATIAEARIQLPERPVIVLLIPPLPEPENTRLRALIEHTEPRRVIYISSTSVYGGIPEVNEKTVPGPEDERGRARLDEERWVSSGPWSSLILRSAAIYGPGRGVHAALRAGKIPRGAGAGIISRIHVDDLAAIIEAGIFSNLTGAWPVADDMECATNEIAAWCAMHLKLPDFGSTLIRAAIKGRSVDGTKIRHMLGVELRYPSWQTGIPASLAEEED